MAERKLWTKDELIIVFNLYLKLPFGKLHTSTTEVIEMAELLGRSVNSIAIRLNNFASCDPYHQQRGIKGMVGGLKQCQPIWDEFSENRELLLYESERILAERQNLTIENKFNEILYDLKDFRGETKFRTVKTRVNQYVFRQMVVANYSGRCAVSGIDIPELLLASHIIPWSQNEEERLNPANGICLSALYDRAFDKGLIGIKENFEIVLSSKIKKEMKKDYYSRYFEPIEHNKTNLPRKYAPKKEFLQYHLDKVFEK